VIQKAIHPGFAESEITGAEKPRQDGNRQPDELVHVRMMHCGIATEEDPVQSFRNLAISAAKTNTYSNQYVAADVAADGICTHKA
jgi:hypothetical protein